MGKWFRETHKPSCNLFYVLAWHDNRLHFIEKFSDFVIKSFHEIIFEMSENGLDFCLSKKPQELRMLHFLKHHTSEYDKIAEKMGVSSDERLILINDERLTTDYHKTHKVIGLYLNSDKEQTWRYFVKCLRGCGLDALASHVTKEIRKKDIDRPVPTFEFPERSPNDIRSKRPLLREILNIIKGMVDEHHAISVMLGCNLSDYHTVTSNKIFSTEDERVGEIVNKWLRETDNPTWDLFYALACHDDRPWIVEKTAVFITKRIVKSM